MSNPLSRPVPRPSLEGQKGRFQGYLSSFWPSKKYPHGSSFSIIVHATVLVEESILPSPPLGHTIRLNNESIFHFSSRLRLRMRFVFVQVASSSSFATKYSSKMNLP